MTIRPPSLGGAGPVDAQIVEGPAASPAPVPVGALDLDAATPFPAVQGGPVVASPELRPAGLALEVARGLPSVPRFRGAPLLNDAQAQDMRAKIEVAEADAGRAADSAAALLTAARDRLAAAGVGTEPCVTPGGYEGLRIVPDQGASVGQLAGFLQDEVDGFTLVYSPAKLFAEHTRGAVWGHKRMVACAHDLVIDAFVDPITRHEVEHAVLNLAEEQGIANPWLGFMQSIDGSALSDVAADVGGYVTYCSLQEVPAYAAQVATLARRLEMDPVPGQDLDELVDMARWGRALAGRAEDVARRASAWLEQHPENAVFEHRQLTPEGRDPAGTPELLWVSVDTPSVRVSFPVLDPDSQAAFADMQAANGGAPEDWAAARAPLLAGVRRHLDGVADRAEQSKLRFSAVEQDAEQARGQPGADLRAVARRALAAR